MFKDGEKYDYVKDVKDAYFRSLKTTTEDKIFDKIPDYIFWDIKVPVNPRVPFRKNRYNSFRGLEFRDFFEMRGWENYHHRQSYKENIDDSVSLASRY